MNFELRASLGREMLGNGQTDREVSESLTHVGQPYLQAPIESRLLDFDAIQTGLLDPLDAIFLPELSSPSETSNGPLLSNNLLGNKNPDDPFLLRPSLLPCSHAEYGGSVLDSYFVCPRDVEQKVVPFGSCNTFEASPTSSDSLPLDEFNSSVSAPDGGPAEPKTPESSGSSNSVTSTGRHAMRQRTSLIKNWLQDHASSPYATDEQLNKLIETTGLSERQVRVCLSNFRARMKLSDESKALPSPNHELSPTSNTLCATDRPLSPHFASALSMYREPCEHPYNFGSSLSEMIGIASSRGEAVLNIPAGVDLNAYPCVLGALEAPTTEYSPQAFIKATAQMSKRKGKRSYPSRYRARGQSMSQSISDASSDHAGERIKAFHCTVCPKSFKDVYAWKRHESGVHDFHVKEWTCILDGLLFDKNRCVFCTEGIDDPDHFDQHNISSCLTRGLMDRTFGRKDLLKQHVLQVHLNNMDDRTKKGFQVPEFWMHDTDVIKSSPASLWCGFCYMFLESTASRMDHVADHFRNGLEMENWQAIPIT